MSDALEIPAAAPAPQAPSLTCYALHAFAPKLVPAAVRRPWMDAFYGQQAYNCLPMTIANAYGWDLLCPAPLEIEWNGGRAVGDVSVRALKPLPGGGPVHYFCRSHFSSGIVTMHIDWIFRTEPGWNLLVTGPLNGPKENGYALSGIVDTDTLDYPATMNWQVLRPGRLSFDEDEPFCTVLPVSVAAVAECEPQRRRLADDPALKARYEALRAGRERGAAS